MTFSLPLSFVVDLNISSQSCDFANNMAESLGPSVQFVLRAVIDTDALRSSEVDGEARILIVPALRIPWPGQVWLIRTHDNFRCIILRQTTPNTTTHNYGLVPTFCSDLGVSQDFVDI